MLKFSLIQIGLTNTPQYNEVVERHNWTLMDMVRSMMSNTSLPSFLWGEVLKTTMYILNRVPSMTIRRTPLDLWTNSEEA